MSSVSILNVTKVKLTVSRIEGALGVFVRATDAFNKNKWDDYSKCLDENVIAYNITIANYVKGRDNVVNYFKGISDADDPTALQFDVGPKITWLPPLFPLMVEGDAKWTHKAAGHVKMPIKYQVFFAPDDSSLMTGIWATHSDGS